MSKENNKNLNEETVENVVEENKEIGTNDAENKEKVSKIEKIEEVTKIVDEPEESPIKDEEVKEKKVEEIDGNASIGKRIFASVLDQAILFGLSAIVVVIFALIIKIFGYYIVSPVPMLLIAYVVLNILYLPVFELKKGRSIGKRILGIL